MVQYGYRFTYSFCGEFERSYMSLIISENGQNAERLTPRGFDKENYLQQYIYNNPDAVPVYEIDEDIRLLILAREFNTQSGPIDALGVDQNGNIYLIETKLYKNQDKRKVVAQVLDYGASLWSSSLDFTDFLLQLDRHVQSQFDMTTTEKLQEFFALEIDDIDLLINNIQNNLGNGIFKFVVLMDNLHKQLKDLIAFLNRNSQFDIYAVELEYYKHNKYEIIIPKMFGTEVKKDVVSTKTGSNARRRWDKTSYWQEVNSTLDSKKIHALQKLYNWSVENADEITWGTGAARGSFSPRFTHISSLSFISVFSDGTLQVSYGYLPEDIEVRKRLRNTLSKYIDVPGVTNISDDNLGRYPSIYPDYVADHVEKIITGLNEFVGIPRS